MIRKITDQLWFTFSIISIGILWILLPAEACKPIECGDSIAGVFAASASIDEGLDRGRGALLNALQFETAHITIEYESPEFLKDPPEWYRRLPYYVPSFGGPPGLGPFHEDQNETPKMLGKSAEKTAKLEIAAASPPSGFRRGSSPILI